MLHRHGQQIPRVKVPPCRNLQQITRHDVQYTEEEVNTWSQILRKLKVLHTKYACRSLNFPLNPCSYKSIFCHPVLW